MRPPTRSFCIAQLTLIFRINCGISDHDRSFCPGEHQRAHATGEVIHTRLPEHFLELVVFALCSGSDTRGRGVCVGVVE